MGNGTRTSPMVNHKALNDYVKPWDLYWLGTWSQQYLWMQITSLLLRVLVLLFTIWLLHLRIQETVSWWSALTMEALMATCAWDLKSIWYHFISTTTVTRIGIYQWMWIRWRRHGKNMLKQKAKRSRHWSSRILTIHLAGKRKNGIPLSAMDADDGFYIDASHKNPLKPYCDTHLNTICMSSRTRSTHSPHSATCYPTTTWSMIPFFRCWACPISTNWLILPSFTWCMAYPKTLASMVYVWDLLLISIIQPFEMYCQVSCK